MMIDKKTRGEICQEYRLAKDQNEQVNILAELYATSTAEIRGILWDGGVYRIGPEQIAKAAARILEGSVGFGSLRNYVKEFSGIDAKTAKKIFKDYAYRPWGSEGLPEAEAIREQVKNAIEAVKERAEARKAPGPVAPPLSDPAREFTPEEVGILVNGLLSIQAQDAALENQLRHEIEEMHKKAAELLDAAERRMQDLNEVTARINQGKELLQRLEELNKEEAAATT